MLSGKALNPFQPPVPSHAPRLHCITYVLRRKYNCFSLGALTCCLPDGMDGFLFIRGHLLTEMDFSVACLWGLGFSAQREVRASLFCCFCKDCAHSTSLSYTVSWHIFRIPKFSDCRHGIMGFGSHLELNTHKTDSKYFNINWEIDRHMDTITNSQTYSFCVARNGSCRVHGRKLRLFSGPSRALARTSCLHVAVCNTEAWQLAAQVKSPNDNVVRWI